jgi:hypothetical protein
MRIRRGTLALAALIAARGALAQSGTGQNLPHAFPREGATQVVDNAWGTAWDATWTPHKVGPMHRHAYDYVGIELVSSTFNVISAQGQTRAGSKNKGDAYFLPKGTTHAEEGVSSDPPRHAILIDLKDTATASFQNTTKYPSAFTEAVAKKAVDNQRVTIWDRTWSPSDTATTFFYDKNVFVVILDGGELTMTSPGQPPVSQRLVPGQVFFAAGGKARTERSTSGTVRAIIVVLK